MYICMYVYNYTYTYLSSCICIYVYMYVHVYMYINIYIYTWLDYDCLKKKIKGRFTMVNHVPPTQNGWTFPMFDLLKVLDLTRK